MNIVTSNSFSTATKKLDGFLKTKLKKQIQKVIDNPNIGKPLKYARDERSIYIQPFRLVYTYSKAEDILYLLKFEHRRKVYD